MKRLIIFLCMAVCMAVFPAFSQRYLPEQKGLHINVGGINGFVSDAFYLNGGLSKYTDKANRWIYGIEYLQKKLPYNEILIPVARFTAEGGYYLNFLSDRSKTFFFSIGGSVMAGYESVNWNSKLLYNGASIENRDGFIYGGAVGFEIETFFADRVILLTNLRERILFGSSVNKFNFQLGIGVKIIIN